MAIKVIRELMKNSGGFLIPVIVAIPLLVMIATLPVAVENENPDVMDDTTFILFLFLPFIILIPIVPMFTRTNAMQIIKTANIEKRMERLKKLGAEEFIKQTNARLVSESERGNKLFETADVIKGRVLKFLVYGDISTDRQYVSFVQDSFIDADDAMASKFSLSQSEYALLHKDNEA